MSLKELSIIFILILSFYFPVSTGIADPVVIVGNTGTVYDNLIISNIYERNLIALDVVNSSNLVFNDLNIFNVSSYPNSETYIISIKGSSNITFNNPIIHDIDDNYITRIVHIEDSINISFNGLIVENITSPNIFTFTIYQSSNVNITDSVFNSIHANDEDLIRERGQLLGIYETNSVTIMNNIFDHVISEDGISVDRSHDILFINNYLNVSVKSDRSELDVQLSSGIILDNNSFIRGDNGIKFDFTHDNDLRIRNNKIDGRLSIEDTSDLVIENNVLNQSNFPNMNVTDIIRLNNINNIELDNNRIHNNNTIKLYIFRVRQFVDHVYTSLDKISSLNTSILQIETTINVSIQLKRDNKVVRTDYMQGIHNYTIDKSILVSGFDYYNVSHSFAMTVKFKDLSVQSIYYFDFTSLTFVTTEGEVSDENIEDTNGPLLILGLAILSVVGLAGVIQYMMKENIDIMKIIKDRIKFIRKK